jgi:putative zinc finger protein/tetratricopeptide repeat protein
VTCSSALRDRLTFWVAGTLDGPETALVVEHVAHCADCRSEVEETRRLMEGFRELHLRADEVIAVAEAERDPPHLQHCRRCREEVELLRSVNADLERAAGAAWRRPLPVGLAAAAGVILTLLVARQFVSRPSPSRAASPQIVAAKQPAASAPPKIRVEKAPVTLLAADILVLRGKPSARQQFLGELASALEPYRRDDFADAATRLRGLAGRFPQAPEPPYYLGVSLLMLNRPADAIAPLQEAARIVSPPDDVRYYLAVAQVNAGDIASGVALLRQLCDRKTESSRRACASLQEATGGRR